MPIEENRHVIEKTETLWPIGCVLEAKEIKGKMWSTHQWQLNGFDLQLNDKSLPTMLLELFKDERTDYRFNLSSVQPKLFVVLESNDDEQAKLVAITASQSIAGQYMDGDYLVLSANMPLAVQAWMEAFIGRHGELLEQRRKKRKGAGRSSGQ